MSLILLGILNSQAAGGAGQNYYVGISDFLSGNYVSYGFTANNRIVGFGSDGPSGDVGTIVQLDGTGAVEYANDIRTDVPGGDNRARVRVGNTIGGVDYLVVTGEDTGNSDSHTIKLAADGTIDWGRYLGRGTGGTNNVIPYDTTADSSGNVYTLVTDDATGNLELAKWNASGVLQWKIAYTQASFALTNRRGSLSTDASGNLYWHAHITDNSATGFGNVVGVIKLNPASGAVVWQKYFEFADDAPFGRGVVDSAGNSYVTCRAQVGASFTDWALPLVKYDSNGTLQWETNLNFGTTDLVDGVYKPIIDSTGNVIVASSVGGSINGLAVASFDPSGTLNWQRLITNSRGNRPSVFLQMALNIDSNDNVFLPMSWSDGTNIEQTVIVFPSNGDFIGSYTDGTDTWTVAASSGTDIGGFSAVTPAATVATSSSALTEGATTMQLFGRSFNLRVLNKV